MPRPEPFALERAPSIAEPPPEPPAGITWAECEGWATCLDDASMRLLWTWLRAHRAWADEAWIRCGPEPELETP